MVVLSRYKGHDVRTIAERLKAAFGEPLRVMTGEGGFKRYAVQALAQDQNAAATLKARFARHSALKYIQVLPQPIHAKSPSLNRALSEANVDNPHKVNSLNVLRDRGLIVSGSRHSLLTQITHKAVCDALRDSEAHSNREKRKYKFSCSVDSFNVDESVTEPVVVQMRAPCKEGAHHTAIGCSFIRANGVGIQLTPFLREIFALEMGSFTSFTINRVWFRVCDMGHGLVHTLSVGRALAQHLMSAGLKKHGECHQALAETAIQKTISRKFARHFGPIQKPSGVGRHGSPRIRSGFGLGCPFAFQIANCYQFRLKLLHQLSNNLAAFENIRRQINLFFHPILLGLTALNMRGAGVWGLFQKEFNFETA